MLRALFGPEERRRDPEDGIFRTYAELQEACKGKYGEAEIRHYWETECQRGQEEPVLDERKMVSLERDPFLTHHVHSRARQQASSDPFHVGGAAGAASRHEERFANVQQNPFITGDHAETVNVRRDPFLTGLQGGRALHPMDSAASIPGSAGSLCRRQQHFHEAAGKARRHWTEVAARVLGPGDSERKPSVRSALILAPWLAFTWTLLLWLLVNYFSPHLCQLLTALLLLGSCALVAEGALGRQWAPVPLLPLGLLCLLAALAGGAAGHIGWQAYWRQYWWMQTGGRTELSSAATPAAGQVDAAVIGFWDVDHGRTVNGTCVDDLRSAGFKDEHYYCVAPIVSPETAGGSLVRVNYWAVGIDCCQRSGSFTCDSSRSYEGGYGVVMLEGGFPCPGCHAEQFRAAVRKAESLHSLVSAPGALLVRWVRRPGMVEASQLAQGMLFAIGISIAALAVLAVLGSAAWYYGLGRRPLLKAHAGVLFEDFMDGSRQKLLS